MLIVIYKVTENADSEPKIWKIMSPAGIIHCLIKPDLSCPSLFVLNNACALGAEFNEA